MKFSHRTEWHLRENPLTLALRKRLAGGKGIRDLTLSNPTDCGIAYPKSALLKALARPQGLTYRPDPRGLSGARKAVAGYYRQKHVRVDPRHIILTSSTSEAYSSLFTLLCEPGDSILVPSPSYPLFEFIAQLGSLELRPYSLSYDHAWQIDTESILSSLGEETRAIVLIHPHNPTGFFLKREQFKLITNLARKHDLALIVDEVFAEYSYRQDPARLRTSAGTSSVLTFTLGGLSKMAGLPQMKLSWIAAGGPQRELQEALARLEIISDTFLSVNTPVQSALPRLLRAGRQVRTAILRRVKANYAFLKKASAGSPCTVLESEGGWYAVLRVPRTRTDEGWAVELLEKEGIYLYPGYFFDFKEEGILVVSLLVEEEEFHAAARNLLEYVRSVS